jgi:hypothetical protein
MCLRQPVDENTMMCACKVVRPIKHMMKEANPATVKRTVVKAKKTVQFATYRNKVATVALQQDINDLKELWLTKQDYKRIARERDETVNANAKVNGNANLLDPDQHTLRGIEQYAFPEVDARKRTRTKLVIHTVLVSQTLCRQMRTNKDMIAASLRVVSESQTAASKKRALALAKVDEMAALRHQGWEIL